jgi:2-amino-4-hydroxy-6-hydroxymethyldihydropteridine diphosphokinase
VPDSPIERQVPKPARYFIGLGSNLGDREHTLQEAWTRVGSLCTQSRLSSIYETRPLYVEDQPRYLNAVGEAWSGLDPAQMLAELQGIEAAFGRDRAREVRRGARTLDLDILLCDGLVMDAPGLLIPHPLMTERLFVLVPLLELDPGLSDPRTAEPYRAARAALEAAGGGGGVYLHRGGRYT